MQNHALPRPKGKKMENTYVELMRVLFHGEYPEILNHMIQLDPDYLDNLLATECGSKSIFEISLSPAFFKSFITASRKNPDDALTILQELETKTPKDVEKVFSYFLPIDDD
jgi:hypothetical protein